MSRWDENERDFNERRLDMFRAAALTGMLANPSVRGEPEEYAAQAERFARAMLKVANGDP